MRAVASPAWEAMEELPPYVPCADPKDVRKFLTSPAGRHPRRRHGRGLIGRFREGSRAHYGVALTENADPVRPQIAHARAVVEKPHTDVR